VGIILSVSRGEQDETYVTQQGNAEINTKNVAKAA
jgi:hypothetical protein